MGIESFDISPEVPPQEEMTNGGEEKIENFSEQGTLEQREINKLSILLELTEKAAEEKYTITNELVESLQKDIAEARAKGINLSHNGDFSGRIERLTEMAPVASIEGALGKLKEVKDFEFEDDTEGHRKRLAIASWYWDVKEKLFQYGNGLKEGKRKEIEKELQEVAAELGIE